MHSDDRPTEFEQFLSDHGATINLIEAMFMSEVDIKAKRRTRVDLVKEHLGNRADPVAPDICSDLHYEFMNLPGGYGPRNNRRCIHLDSEYKPTTVLIIAASKGYAEIVTLLLDEIKRTRYVDNKTSVLVEDTMPDRDLKNNIEKYKQVKKVCDDKVNALIAAARNGHTSVVKVILNWTSKPTGNRADTNLKDYEGFTALMEAVKCKKPEMIDALIKAGANVLITNEDGDNALQIAMNAYKKAEAEKSKDTTLLYSICKTLKEHTDKEKAKLH